MRVSDLIKGYQERDIQLLQRVRNKILDVAVFVSAHFNGDALVDRTVSCDVEIAARDLVDRRSHSRGQADNFFNAVVLHVVKDKDTFDGHSRARGLGNGIAAGDQLVALGDLDRGLGAGTRDGGFLSLPGFAGFLALKCWVVGAVLGLGRRAFSFEATARVTASANLRAFLRTRFSYGTATSIISSHRVSLFRRELTQAYGVGTHRGGEGARGLIYTPRGFLLPLMCTDYPMLQVAPSFPSAT